MNTRQEHKEISAKGRAAFDAPKGGRSRRGRPPHKRATQISISIPQSLVEVVDKMAESENRNRSNFISAALRRIVEDFFNSKQ